jgi:2-oxoglutarate dehydrogenase E1 component
MYKAIRNHPTTREIYAKQLVDENVMTQAEVDKMAADFQAKLEGEFEAASHYKPNRADWLEGKWAGLEAATGDDRRGNTAVEIDVLKEVGKTISAVPKDVKLNSKIVRQLKAKHRRSARLRYAAGRRHPGPPVRSGLWPRHLLAASFGAGRSGERKPLRSAQPHP